MFLASSKELVAAQCRAGVVGSFPSLNARPQESFDEWLTCIESSLAGWNAEHPERPAAPYAVNLIVHPTNPRLESDLDTVVAHRVPVVITSLNEPSRVVERVHAYGGMVLHDAASVRHARKAVDAGVDGLVLVCAGAGGHTGTLNPFAFIEEVRRWFDGLVAVSGAISTGRQVFAAQVMGADFAYVGTRFLATTEAAATPLHKQLVVDAQAADIVCSTAVTGLPANYLRASFERLGLDPDALQPRERGTFSLGRQGGVTEAKAWRDIWGAGQGVAAVEGIEPTAAVVERLLAEYQAARGAWGLA